MALHGPGVSERQLTDEILDAFEAAWRPDQAPSIATFLGSCSGELRQRILLELIKIDVARCCGANVDDRLDQHLLEFPELSAHEHELRVFREGQRGTRLLEASPEILVTIGKYRIVDQLAEHGQGYVYRAVHPVTRQDVVVKLAKRKVARDSALEHELVNEAKLLSELAHPNIPRFYDADFHDDRPYIVMEYLTGQNLAQFVQTRRPGAREAAQIMLQVGGAVTHAHSKGILHLDLKPQNVLIGADERAYVLDFGLAIWRQCVAGEERTRDATGVTFAYAAPEQMEFASERLDQRTDVFGLGAILFELLTGGPPYPGAVSDELIERISRGEYDSAALVQSPMPRRLKEMCRKALARNPAERYASADALARDLRTYLRRPIVWGMAAALLAGGAILFGARAALPTANPAPGELELILRVRRNERWFNDLGALLPLENGDELKVMALVPAGFGVSVFDVDAEGKVNLLQSFDAKEDAYTLTYPPAGSLALAGTAGTQLVLACARAGEPPTLDEIAALWNSLDQTQTGDWAKLEAQTLIRVEPDGVRLEQSGRSFELRPSGRDPDGEVLAMLERLREQLKQQGQVFEGLAFRYGE